MEYELIFMECPCGAKLTVKTYIFRGFSDHEMVICPICKNSVKEIRADMGYEIIEVAKPINDVK